MEDPYRITPLTPEWEEEGVPVDNEAEPEDADVDHQGEIEEDEA